VWTIGFGETKNVGPHTKPVSRVQALRQLRARLNRDYLPAVLAANPHLTQRQIDGFTSFVYNVGPGALSSSTSVGKLLRGGHWGMAATAILAWDKAGGHPLAGLTRRRRAERLVIVQGYAAATKYLNSGRI
jgi:lysozyme